MASLPDFDPNDRPRPPDQGRPVRQPAVQPRGAGRLRAGLDLQDLRRRRRRWSWASSTPHTMIDTKGPMRWGRFRIRDFHNYGAELSVTDVIVKSSNIGTARIAMQIGAERQQAFLRQAGLARADAGRAGRGARRPSRCCRSNWSEIVDDDDHPTATACRPARCTSPRPMPRSLNGGTRVHADAAEARHGRSRGERVVSRPTSRQRRATCCAQVVTRGTASFGEVPGYEVGGKTGTADKPKPNAAATTTTRSSPPSPRSSRPTIRNTCWSSRWTSPSETLGRPSRAAPPAGPPCRSPPR